MATKLFYLAITLALQLMCASLAQADTVYTNTGNRHAQIYLPDTNQEAISYLAIYIMAMCILHMTLCYKLT